MADPKFRQSLPPSLSDAVQQYEANPGCGCNHKVYRRILQEAAEQLRQYYPQASEIMNPEEELAKLAQNNWKVINCTIHELEDVLKKLPPGRKQLAVARYEEDLTIVVNELDVVF